MSALAYGSYQQQFPADCQLTSYERLLEWLQKIYEIFAVQLHTSRITSSVRSSAISYVEYTDYRDATSVILGEDKEADIRPMIEHCYKLHFDACLGAHAANRLEMLFECDYGWDGADASSISLTSVDAAARFIGSHNLSKKEVGVFMNAEGYVVLNWPKPDDNGLVEITFCPDSHSIYVTGWDDEEYILFGDRKFEDAITPYL